MHIDARQLTEGLSITFDVCVVGGGAAGITLAREFLGSGISVVLVESGGLNFDPRVQALYDVEDVGSPRYPFRTSRTSRVRYFGGTTNHWGGQSRPLDPIDFESRPWVPSSGWPIGLPELEPFYRRAQDVCELGPYEYSDPGFWADSEVGREAFPFSESSVENKVYQYSPPTRFGSTYRTELFTASNVTVLTHANAFSLETDGAGTVVERLSVKVIDGPTFAVHARHYVLACGGIENARLLLFSKSQAHPNGLGNNTDCVGRYFAEHPTVYSGTVHPGRQARSASFYAHAVVRETIVRGLVHLSENAQRENQLLNLGASLNPLQEGGYVALKRVVGRAIGRGTATDLRGDLKTILGNLAGVADGLRRRVTGGSKFMPARLYSFKRPLRLYCKLEQSPNPESRVSLSETRDELGQNIARLNWRLTETDRQTIVEGTRIIGDEFARLGIGRLEKDDWLDEGGGWPEIEVNGHHTGTTRMTENAKDGVVDPYCRVYGVANMFVAGASVFPTAGCVNPTLTIVALSVRLADHLKRQLGSNNLTATESHERSLST